MSIDRALVDVAVVGAGPAGAAAATTLARAGLSCVLVDRASFPRDKCCGDGLTTGALRELDDLGLDVGSLPSFMALADLGFRSPSGRTSVLPLPRGPGCYGAVVRRIDLDAALVDLARSAGARLLLGDAVVGLEPTGQPPTGGGGAADRGGRDDRQGAGGGRAGVALTLAGGGGLVARQVIAADGAWSPLRKLADACPAGEPGGGAAGRRAAGGYRARLLAALLPPPPPAPGSPGRLDFHAFRAYAGGVSAEASRRLWVVFDERLLPGYAWSFPLPGGRANVGICLRRNDEVRGRQLAAAWREVLAAPFVSSLLGRHASLAPARSWPIPAGVSLDRLDALGGRVLFAGDAARAADPFTGEGIAQALQSGGAAAHAVLSSDGCAPEAARRYRDEIARTLLADQVVARLSAAVMSRPAGADAAVATVGAGPRMRRVSARWLFEDVPRGVLLEPGAWRLLRRPGRAPFPALGGPADAGAQSVRPPRP